MTVEDLIESAPRPKSAWRQQKERFLQRSAAVAVLVAFSLIAGSITGYVVGQSNPPTMTGIYGYPVDVGPAAEGGLIDGPFSDPYGRDPPPGLTLEDLAALGEDVNRQFSVLSGQSTIPIMCGTGLGQPGTGDALDPSHPSTVFRVEGGKISQIVWPQSDAATASGTLHTLTFQAQLCPGVPNSAATILTGGVLTGIGDEYAVFYRKPTVSGPTVFFATVALVRVGADLIEVSFTSDIIELPDAQARCLRAAAAAVEKATGG